ncbi:MAG: hypothetical protein K2L82_02575 [Lachnospiraceae bacterium]|nr:hypothetical protein [Lachnospiraceae bacterium]
MNFSEIIHQGESLIEETIQPPTLPTATMNSATTSPGPSVKNWKRQASRILTPGREKDSPSGTQATVTIH